MPTDDSKMEKLFIGTGDDRTGFTKFEPIADCTDVIESVGLEEYEINNLSGNGKLELSFNIDKQAAQEIHSVLHPNHGEKLTVETSCVCDGTLLFAIQLMQTLVRIGAVNIKLWSEMVEDPDPKWMSCRFIANGIVWNTNNFRKMHGIPMKRRGRI